MKCAHVAGRVGKTSLALRFVHNTFSHNQQATLQASFLSKRVEAGGKEVMDAVAYLHGDSPTKLSHSCLIDCRLSLQSGTQQDKSVFMLWDLYIIEMHRLPCLSMI